MSRITGRWIITQSMYQLDAPIPRHSESKRVDYTLAFRVMTPEAVLKQFNLLMMNKIAQNM
jgi:hypothetical protein